MELRDVATVIAARRGLARMLRRRALLEGVLAGRKTWLVIGAVMWGAHGIRRAGRREEQVLLREVLEPGTTFVVRQAITRPTRKQQRRLNKAAAVPDAG